MEHLFKRIISVFLVAISAVLTFFDIGTKQAICPDTKGISFEEIQSIKDAGYSLNEYKKLIDNDGTQGDFVCKDGTFTVTAGGADIPTYTVPLYSGKVDKGTLHSFCYIEKDSSAEFEVKIKTSVLLNPQIYPEKDFYRGLNFVSFKIQSGETGTYTFFSNKNSDKKVLTIRIFDSRNDEKNIENYQQNFGKENVIVFEKGTHEIEQIFLKSDTVLYLKSGAFLKVKQSEKIGGAIKAENFENIIIDGRGVLNLSALRWHERNGMEFLFGENLTVKDITILNSANWSCYLYNVKNAVIENVSIFGSRQNGDGIGICNSSDVTVKNCFVRAGDDCYNVKTLGSETDSISENIVFQNNVAWATKARGAGITGETNCDIRNVVFKDMCILRCDATWNDARIGALAVVTEEGSGNIDGVYFENIDIISSACPPILVSVLSDRDDVKMDNIHFENISYNSKKEPSIFKGADSNGINCEFKNILRNT
ncbi:MAG: glycosyl hydrolase family 28 protein [Clostridia bacterium]|nr:glycosyl hydrolase family 28 protein [Clostridia bacterium]